MSWNNGIHCTSLYSYDMKNIQMPCDVSNIGNPFTIHIIFKLGLFVFKAQGKAMVLSYPAEIFKMIYELKWMSEINEF